MTHTNLATDLARLHASIIRLEQENDGDGEPHWLGLYGAETADLTSALALAEELENAPGAIPKVLAAYAGALSQPLYEAQAAYEEQPQDGSHKAKLAGMKVREWERKQKELRIDPETGTIRFHQDRSTAITLHWEAPGKVTVVDMSDHYPGLHLGWWLLLTTRDAARNMMRTKSDHPDTKEDGYWTDFVILKDAPSELDWITCIDDYCDLGGRALAWAEQALTRWAPNMEVTRPRRVRMYQLEQARQMAAAGITPVLATPAPYTVMVVSEQDATRQGVEHDLIPEEMLATPPSWYWVWSMCRDLNETVMDKYAFRPQGHGAAQYKPSHVQEFQGPTKTVKIVEGKRDLWDRYGTRRFREEFPDTFPGAEMLAGYAYPHAWIN